MQWNGFWLGICLVLSQQVAWGADANDEVVAKMGSMRLTRAELLKLAEPQADALKGDKQAAAIALEKIARAALLQRAVVAEAKKAQWEKRPEAQAQIERAKEQALAASYMNHLARPASAYPSEDELKRAYEENKNKLTTPEEVRIAQIYLAAGADPAKAEREAHELARKAGEKGADFAELARKHSNHAQSAKNGGDMGWGGEDRLQPEIRAALRSLGVGEVSKPVKSATGWHVLRLVERKESRVRTYAEASTELAQIMRLRRAEQNEREYMNKLIAQTPITVDEIALNRLIEAK